MGRKKKGEKEIKSSEEMAKEIDVINQIVGGINTNIVEVFTPDDAQEFLMWMTGQVTDPPKVLQKIFNNFANKLNMGMAYILAVNLQRMNKMLNFLKKAEELIFDESSLYNRDLKDLTELYNVSAKIMNDTLEFMRKFIVQNRDTWENTNNSSDKLKNLILNLPADKIDDLIDKIEKGDI